MYMYLKYKHRSPAENSVTETLCTSGLLFIQVEYDVSGFLDKNRDTLPPSVQMLMKSKQMYNYVAIYIILCNYYVDY